MHRLKNLPPLCPKTIDLGNGCILRRAENTDKNALIAFNGAIHGSDVVFGGSIKNILDTDVDPKAKHPVLGAHCMTVVIDTTKKAPLAETTEGLDDSSFLTADGLLVSTSMGVPQIWTYGNTDGSFLPDSLSPAPARASLLVFRPEAISTHPAYRSRGFVDKQMHVHHQWATDMKADLSYIYGIHGFYRRFGYEFTADLFAGRSGYLATLPRLDPGATESYTFRDATLDDVTFLTKVDRANAARRRNIAADLDEAWWGNLVAGRKSKGAFNRRDTYVIESVGDKQPVGFVQFDSDGNVVRYEVDPTASSHSWFLINPALLRWMPVRALKLIQEESPETTSLPADYSYTLSVSSRHPIFKTINVEAHLPKANPPFKLYTRTMNIHQFLTNIIPVLNARLQSSSFWHSFSGNLAILQSPTNAAAKGGCMIHISKGAIEKVEQGPKGESADGLGESGVHVFCPVSETLLSHVFMGTLTASQLLDRYRGDVIATGVATSLLDALFPEVNSAEICGLD
ncbi:hypothetical protein HDU97_006614 [Phlyctochytrium planicorne]|nr:hypothetical protein HDU97_006614 [Phlyctochytrium planicorne]